MLHYLCNISILQYFLCVLGRHIDAGKARQMYSTSCRSATIALMNVDVSHPLIVPILLVLATP
jgi:hypothetical protein